MVVHDVFPYLCVKDAGAAIEFYVRAFGGVEKYRLVEPSGRIGHAEVALGNFTLMLAEEYPEYGFRGPEPGSVPTSLVHLHVDDADEVVRRAVEAGATIVRPCEDSFYGERGGRIRDPFGHEWLIGHSIEEVTPEEMQRRYTALFEGGAETAGCGDGTSGAAG